ncbi:hypothetical protein KYT87_27895 [Achromobacter sp. ES-001]|uniref:hypothetical protein n=1 Tax=Achromobacter sp. ES-001 TaxID=2860286 RepID=UPI001C63C6E3|nr:hypothetical protein [Achromobacter sp. ES-001]QYJ21362.1 hypothetical protein KYT87_27895 [Achromobacter sp. ES-001]
MDYKDYPKINRNDAEIAFASGDVRSICEALVSVSLYGEDGKWAQNKCLEFLRSENSDIKGVAAIGLGHIARVHRQLDKEKVLAALRRHQHDVAISGQVEDAIDDINMFVP